MNQQSRILMVATLSLALSACSQAAFQSGADSAISTNNVMGNDESGGTIQQPPTDDSSGTINQPPGADPTPVADTAYFLSPGQKTIRTELLCTHHETNVMNLKLAESLQKVILMTVNNRRCSVDQSMIHALLMKPEVSVADIRALCPSMVPMSGALSLELYVDNKSLRYTQSDPKAFSVHYASWKNASATESKDENCDKLVSPLVLQVEPGPAGPMNLSKWDNGVNFDLLGNTKTYLGKQNNGRKVRVSWFTNGNYRLLTLPQGGVVKGIDQLFGDNTKVTADQKQEDGYQALAKHDSNKDGFIDEQDPVFHQLRLWHDKDRNGLGEGDELQPLSAFNMKRLNLNHKGDQYDKKDAFGNEAKMFSTVEFNDGQFGVMFDLWFRYRLASQ